MTLANFTKVAMLAIGDELLRGDVTDLNTPYLAKWLTAHGAILERVVIVPDDQDQIITELRRLKEHYSIIFTSGGLGPTHDDVTIEAVSAALERQVVVSPEIKKRMIECYGEVNPAKLLMARMPEGSQLLFGAHRWVPVIITDGVYILPGVPQIFAKCIDILDKNFATRELAADFIWLEVAESLIADKLRAIQQKWPEVVIGSYPQMVTPPRVKLNVVHSDSQVVAAVIADLRTAFQQFLVK